MKEITKTTPDNRGVRIELGEGIVYDIKSADEPAPQYPLPEPGGIVVAVNEEGMPYVPKNQAG